MKIDVGLRRNAPYQKNGVFLTKQSFLVRFGRDKLVPWICVQW